MKIKRLLAAVLALAPTTIVHAATTIDPTHKYVYGGNLGWMDATGDTNHGAIIGEYVCSGYLYSANVGWINMGGGSPTNGIRYQNLSSNDFGVNLDGLGNLRGLAYGANIGWINFETNGTATVDLNTGRLSGYAWSANCGWISLSNAVAYVQTTMIAAGADSNGDGIPDAWELQNFGTININPNADPDHDGMSNLQEYLADTNPNNSNDVLRITYAARGDVLPNFTTLHWSGKPTRYYTIQYRSTVNAASSWQDAIGNGIGGTNATFGTGHTNGMEFYRIRANRPLQ